MCGRLNVHDSTAIQKLMSGLGLPALPSRPPRYNITPTSPVDVVLAMDDIAEMEWAIEFRDFRHPNTKVETVKRRPDLQKLLRDNRCLVPVNRFYEWPDPAVRPKWQGIKTRFCIHTPEDVMLLGGIYRINPHGVMQFNILTTDPNEQIADFHHRMPVIVPPAKAPAWMRRRDLAEVYAMTEPYPNELIVYECDGFVDSGRNDDPRCMQPAARTGERSQPQGQLL
ncbi:hypothetical protein SVA_3759 [Sulfurifustis variabilis]|uniref:Abasic site processing protein n=1 Tax=Sulfurifustis variabilis TaxID=1675686 RepID=A0A1C7AFV5_9GAMM|nr:SOS response-associated peptidase family protein [Sulfurifustis variabilis]BAU50293.1 hypothetical protein SVA_3759 [Sulfurifustis variabilis]